MNRPKVLFTSSVYPYPTLPNDTSLTDATGARFTRADGIFCIISHSHHFANHILAQNIDAPSVILEYPRWEDFTSEVRKGYDVIGISALPVHLDNVLKMCRYVREQSPRTKIVLGCHGGMALSATHTEEEWKVYVDEICHGEGVRFMRGLLGESQDKPVTQRLMPKASGSPPFITKYPKGAMGFLVSGLGCPGSCDFCSSTALYDHKRIWMLTPEAMVEHMDVYRRHFRNVSSIFVVDEDHFRWPDWLIGIREPWAKHPELAESLDWFVFGSLDHIGAFANRYGWDAISEIGVGVIFVGVESKFGDLLRYKKRSEVDPRWVFQNLHSRGIRTVGSWICGWDFHNHANVLEDLNYFVALYPTYQQMTRLSPFPGTPLWDRVKAEGRLKDVPWEDIHFWSESQKNVGLEEHETLNLVEQGYDLLYRTWGPSIQRRLDIELDGYKFCTGHANPILRDRKAKLFKKQCGMMWTLLPAMERYAPNGMVRRRARMIDKKYRALIGEPTAVMKLMSGAVLRLAGKEYKRSLLNPSGPRPKEEPFKRYTYHKSDGNGSLFPYKTEWPGGRSWKMRREKGWESVRYFALETALKARRRGARGQTDPLIDDYLIGLVSDQAFGFGL
jgi:hypothetical protein